MKSKIVYLVLIILTLCLAPQIVSAQIAPPDDPTDVPIDGGISLLLAAGVGYGVKKARDKNRKQNNEMNK